MKFNLKIALATSASIAAILAAGVWMASQKYTQQDIVKMVRGAAMDKYGLDANIASLEWSVFPIPSAKVSGLSLSAPNGPMGGPAEFNVESLSITASWPGLLAGKIVPTSINASRVYATLTAVEKNTSNSSVIDKNPPATNFDISAVPSIEIQDASIEIVRPIAHSSSKSTRISLGKTQIAPSGDHLDIHAEISSNNRKAVIHASAKQSSRSGIEFDAEIVGREWIAKATGHAAQSSSDALVDVEAKDAAELGALLGVGLPPGPGKLHAKLAQKDQEFSFEAPVVELGAWTARSTGHISTSSARPNLQASIATTRSSEAKTPKSETAGSMAPIPWNALQSFDADITFSAPDGLGIGLVQNIMAKITVRDGIARIEDLAANLAGGKLSGRARANSANHAIDISATLSGASAEALARNAGASSIAGGAMSGSARLAMAGNDFNALRETLAGEVVFEMSRARWNNSTASAAASLMGGLLPSLGSHSGFIDVECAAARMDFKQGFATGNPMAGIETAAASVLASGSIDARAQMLDLSLDIEPKAGFDIAALSTFASAARVKGPWSSPTVGLDTAKAANGVATLGAAAASGGASLIVQALAAKARGPKPNACLTVLGRLQPAVVQNSRQADPAPTMLSNPIDSLKKLFGR